MSLLKMLKRSVNKAVQAAIDGAVEEKLSPVLESAKDRVEQFVRSASEERMTSVSPATEKSSGQVTLYDHGGRAEEYFLNLLSDSLPGCTLEENVSSARLFSGPSGVQAPRNILITRAGRPALLILLLPKNGYRRKAVTEFKKKCDSAGIRYLQFFLEFRNEADYVVNRVRQAL